MGSRFRVQVQSSSTALAEYWMRRLVSAARFERVWRMGGSLRAKSSVTYFGPAEPGAGGVVQEASFSGHASGHASCLVARMPTAQIQSHPAVHAWANHLLPLQRSQPQNLRLRIFDSHCCGQNALRNPMLENFCRHGKLFCVLLPSLPESHLNSSLQKVWVKHEAFCWDLQGR